MAEDEAPIAAVAAVAGRRLGVATVAAVSAAAREQATATTVASGLPGVTVSAVPATSEPACGTTVSAVVTVSAVAQQSGFTAVADGLAKARLGVVAEAVAEQDAGVRVIGGSVADELANEVPRRSRLSSGGDGGRGSGRHGAEFPAGDCGDRPSLEVQRMGRYRRLRNNQVAAEPGPDTDPLGTTGVPAVITGQRRPDASSTRR